jgi:DNA polymerase-3 subunit beta
VEIRVHRGEFLAELGPMQGIVERKTTIPILSHLLLTAKGDRLHLAATDLDVSLTSSCGGEVLSEGSLAVGAKKFVEIIRALDADEVLLEREEGNQLAIRAGSSRFKIRGLPADDFPNLPTIDGAETIAIPLAQLKRMIAKVLFAVSAEESRFQLNGALLKLRPGFAAMVATDGHRLALVETVLEAATTEDQVLVPRKALQELLRFESEEPLAFRRGQHHLSFRLGRRELTCRILEGTFPDYERVIAKDNDRLVQVDRRRFAEAMARVALLTGERARGVRLQLEDEEIVISAMNPDLGEALERLACNYRGGELKIGMNPDYMQQFLAAVDTEQVRFELKDENSQCLGLPVDGPDSRYLCVIMPMRL